MAYHEEHSMQGEKEYNAFMKKKKKRANIAMWFAILSLVPIPVLVLLFPEAPFLGILVMTFIPVLAFGLTALYMRSKANYKGSYFHITRDEIFIWNPEECHAITEKDILSVELRAYKSKSTFVGLPKTIDYVRSRSTSYTSGNGSRSTTVESTRYKITLKNKTEYFSPYGQREAMNLLPGWINFYSNSESEQEIKQLTLGRKVKRTKK